MKYNFSSRLQKVHDYVEIKKKILAKTHISFIINVTIWKTILLVKMEYRLFGKSGTSCTEHKNTQYSLPNLLESGNTLFSMVTGPVTLPSVWMKPLQVKCFGH